MVEVKFYDRKAVDDALLQFAVVAAKYKGQWVFCRHKQRDTYECPGGHREMGERIEDTAKRELWEETGAIDFELLNMGVYSVVKDGAESFGMLYFAAIEELGELPDLEMEHILLTDDLPTRWTYPEIQPRLLERIEEVRRILASIPL